MWNKLVGWWSELPHGIQAVAMLFGAGFFGVVEKALQDWATGAAVCAAGVAASACAKAYLINAVKAGIVGVAALYVKSSYHK